MELTLKDIIAMAGDLSVVGTLLVAIYLFMSGHIIPRKVYEKLIEQNQELMRGYMKELGDTVTLKVIEAVRKILGD